MEEYQQTHKREIAEKKNEPKWDPVGVHGRELSIYPVDQANYRAKSLIPLDQKAFQDKPFLRTAIKGWHFKHETGSVN